MAPFVRLITQNWQLKLLAFALAVLLWVVVSGEQVQSHSFPVALDVRVSDPRFQVIQSSVPREVDVAFVGPGREFVDLALRPPTLVLDVGDVDSTEAVYTLSPSMVQVPGQLNLAPRAVEALTAHLETVYMEKFGIKAGVFATTATAGASVVE